MVNNINISLYQGAPPTSRTPSNEERRIVTNGSPLYLAKDVLPLCCVTGMSLWTEKSKRDLARFGDLSTLTDLIPEIIQHGKYLGAEWCTSSSHGPWAACDAYTYKRMVYNEYMHKDLPEENYLKFALSKTGSLLLICSCHPNEDR